jgi:hypothetical protein
MRRWRNEEIEPGAEDELEGEWELDPNDPTHPDHDLSVSAGYAGWDPAPKPLLTRRGVILLITALVIVGLLLPFVLVIV